MKMWFYPVAKKRDARLLVEWWNANTSGYFFVRRDVRGKRYYAVIKQ